MYYQNWSELKKFNPVKDGKWDQELLYEYWDPVVIKILSSRLMTFSVLTKMMRPWRNYSLTSC